ncbi:MAG: bacteriohemerythrin [Candidatus Zixiibacteriota bacterium]
MSLINWDENFSIHNEKIDNQHKRLIAIINQLHDAIVNGNAKDVLGNIISDLYDYAKVHFSSEEALFEKYNYSKIEEHKKSHRILCLSVERYQDMFYKNKLSVNEFANFMANWLIDHLMVEDREFGQTLKKIEQTQKITR